MKSWLLVTSAGWGGGSLVIIWHLLVRRVAQLPYHQNTGYSTSQQGNDMQQTHGNIFFVLQSSQQFDSVVKVFIYVKHETAMWSWGRKVFIVI